ncbi:MAG: hypothetical protein JXR03_18575 [Cyclobacteriaceae bacterium]
MKTYFNKISVFGLLIVLLASCYSGQDVAPIDSPDDNPVVTVEPGGDYSSPKEGDVLVYTISVDKFVTQAIDFGVELSESSTVTSSDYTVEGGTLEPFAESTILTVTILADDFPEPDETFSFEINASADIAYNFQLSPNGDVEASNVTVSNVHDETAVTIAIAWPDSSDDWDVYVNDEDDATVASAETGADPEIMLLAADSDDGDYFVEAAAWAVEATVTDFTVSINYPDGSLEEFTMTFDNSLTDNYTEGASGWRLMTITKSGSSFSASADL